MRQASGKFRGYVRSAAALCGLTIGGWLVGCSSASQQTNADPPGASGGASASEAGSGGTSATTGDMGEEAAGDDAQARCAAAELEWKTARKTNYESYPDPGSVECVEYNGCQWAGWFAGCEDQQSPEWVESHDIAAVFPGFEELRHHELCIRSGDRIMIVTVYDTCGDDDCDGCCTRNRGDADALIDLEKHTNDRWGLPDGPIEWADLGVSPRAACN